MLLVRRISNVSEFVGGLTQVAVICVLTASGGIFAVPAVAQEGVTCGMVETANGPQFWGPCPNQGSRQPAPRDRFAAIAVSSSTLKSGSSWNAKSQSEAERLALVYCHKQGASDCKIEVWARNAAWRWRPAMPTAAAPSGRAGPPTGSRRIPRRWPRATV